MPKFTHHIFVCGNQRSPGHPRGCCDPDGADQLRSRFKAALKQRGLVGTVRANRAGCLDQCELGPTVVIYPQAIWYGGVRLSDVDRIVDRTILEGEILPDLLIADELLNTKSSRSPDTTSPRDASSADDSDPEREQVDL